MNDKTSSIHASELNAAISAKNFHFQAMLKIRDITPKNEERVAICRILVSRLTGDRAISADQN